jgi:hypothetical protein
MHSIHKEKGKKEAKKGKRNYYGYSILIWLKTGLDNGE